MDQGGTDFWPDDLAIDVAVKSAVEKAAIWGSPAGKARLAPRLVKMLPPHETYVEPFAGAGSVLFAKEPAENEVVNDLDPDIAHAYKTIKGLTPDGLKKLRGMEWKGSKAAFERVYDSKPTGDIEKLHKFLYLAAHSYGSMRKRSMDPSSEGQTPKVVDRLEKQLARVKKLTVRSGDYAQVVKDFDGKSTLFYLDPPYTGYNAAVKEDQFDDEKFFDVLKSIKGKFLLTCGIRGPLPKNVRSQKGWVAKTIRPPRTIGSMKGVGGPKVLSTLLASNYPLSEATKKAIGALEADGWVIKDYEPEVDEAWDDVEKAEIEKRQPFGTFGGSFRYAERLAKKIPAHKRYVEPFAGAAAVLYRKEPSDEEIIADMDDDVVFLHKFVQKISDATVERLKKFDWSGSQANWQRVLKLSPKSDDERFFKLVYRRTMGRDARPDATHMAGAREGQAGPNPEKFLKAAARMKDVTVVKSDYKATIKKYDGPDTFFFIDPPYPGEWFDKSKAVDIHDFVEVLKTIKGKFIAVVNDNPEHTKAFKSVGRVFRMAINEASGTGGGKQATRLFVSNFGVRKADGEDLVELDEAGRTSAVKNELAIEWKFHRVEKADRGEVPHEVFGEVLIPDDVDAQLDTYSVEEVEAACRKFNEVTAEEGQADHAGRQHKNRLTLKGVRIIESYCAPADMVVEGRKIKNGTWLMRWQILDAALWADIEDGKVTGFSIGGSAVKTPVKAGDCVSKSAISKADLDGIVKPGALAQNRLTDIEVEEVSAVDRAANKRRFIIIKSEDGMTDEERKAEEEAKAKKKQEDDAVAAKKAADDEAAAKAARDAEEAEKAAKAKQEADEETARKAKEKEDAEKAKAAGAPNHPANCDCAMCKNIRAAAEAKKNDPAEDDEVKKAASQHLQLLAEKKAALVAGAEKLLGSVDSLDMNEAMATLDAMSSVLWRARDEMAVVKLAKADGATIENAAGEAAEVAKAAQRIDAKRALISVQKAAGVEPEKKAGKPDADLEKVLDALAGVTKSIGDVSDRLGKLEKAQQDDADAKKKAKEEADAEKAKDEKLAGVTKALGDVSARLAKVEKSTQAPNSSAPAGQRSGTSKADDDSWPEDMARSK
jgi:site-specific DNA-adenine methylase